MSIKPSHLIVLMLIVAVITTTFVMSATIPTWSISIWAYATTAMTAVIAALYAAYQHLASRKVQRQEKSSEIMRTYGTNFVHRIAIINEIITQNPDIQSIINKVDRRAPLRFTRDELLRFPITLKEVSRYTEFMQGSQLRDVKLTTTKKEQYPAISFLPMKEMENLPERQNLATYIADTLNGLEYICMEIESGAADDSYLYGSVHHTFMRFIHNVAISIQNMNVNSVGDENYYPYVTRTYRRWIDKENSNHKIAEKAYSKEQAKKDRKAGIL